MKTLVRYPLKQRLSHFSSFNLIELQSQLNTHQTIEYHLPTISNQKSTIIKRKLLSFLPSSFGKLKLVFNCVYKWLPSFVFNNTIDSESNKIEIAINCILIGDYLNRLMRIQNNTFRKFVSQKYLVLTADFFHIKGSMYGSSLGNPLISNYISKIQSDLSKSNLVLQKPTLTISDFIHYLQWRSSPYHYGYAALNCLKNPSQSPQNSQNMGFLLGLLSHINEINSSNKYFQLKDNLVFSQDIDKQKLDLVLQCIALEIKTQLQKHYIPQY